MNHDFFGDAARINRGLNTPQRHTFDYTHSSTLPAYASAEEMVHALTPSEPVSIVRPAAITRMANWFAMHFPGEVLYAVKTNPDPFVLKTIYAAGVRQFDVASPAEVRLVAELFPDAELHFMHPVKSREAIAEAYYRFGVRHFSLDSHAELEKILEVTAGAPDLSLSVRLSIPNDKAAYSLSGKFGVKLEEAASLMQATRKAAAKFGLCFHVGSQCMAPQAYVQTIGYVRDLLEAVDVALDIVDIGGGFPAAYPGMTPPAMRDYMEAIRHAVATLPIGPHCRVLAEPGRALVAEGGSTLVRVDLRKGNMLYINDGAFGSLYDAANTEFVYPVKAIRRQGELSEHTELFGMYGPTCDSVDVIPTRYTLPADIAEGDWIEIGQLGAYGTTMRTRFNGYYSELAVQLEDSPLLQTKLD